MSGRCGSLDYTPKVLRSLKKIGLITFISRKNETFTTCKRLRL